MRWIALACVVACQSKSAPPAQPPPQPPPPTTPPPAQPAAVHHSTVHVDRRVELISIVERLAGANEYTQAKPTDYVRDVDRELAPFASHRAVTLTKQLRAQHGISFDAPMALAVQLDDHFALRGVPDDERWRGADVNAYVAALQAFATDAKLDAFFTAHAAYFADVENRVREKLDAEDPAGWFDQFFGATSERFVVVPGLLEGPANYGLHTASERIQVIGLGVPDARGLPVVDDEMVEVLVHEMAHSFVNPVFDRHPELAAAGEPIFKLVADTMQHQAYDSARTMLDESGVRAVTVLYVRDRKGAAAAARATRDELRHGFLWIRELADLLAKAHAEHPRDGLEAAVPATVALFTGLGKQYAEHGLPQLPFLGPIDAVATHDVVMVIPATDTPVVRYARGIHDKVFNKAQLVGATANVLAAHANIGVVAYGSPTTNSVVADLAHRAGWTIGDGEIRFGTHAWTGPGLVMIACWPRPDDGKHGIVVYTGARDADIAGINSVWAGGTDWVVARRAADGHYDTLAQGDFSVGDDGVWHP